MTLEEWREEQEDDDFMFRLGNVSKHRTGLPAVIWIEANMDMKHVSPRLLFNNSTSSCLRPGDDADALIPLSLDPNNSEVLLDNAALHISPTELEVIKRWIITNYQPLMQHWNMEIDTAEAISRLTKA